MQDLGVGPNAKPRRGASLSSGFITSRVQSTGFQSGTALRIGHGLGPALLGAPRNDLFYDNSMLTKNLQNCAEA